MHHGKHPKQCISETKREVGFYRHDQWGFACFADKGRTEYLQRRGDLGLRLHLHSIANNANKVINRMYNAQSHDQGYKVMYMVPMC